ncbi:MAG: metallophosphoesterase, partial [Bacteroidota bacterium]
MRYAIGDVHGCLRELRILIEEKLVLSRQDELYFVGDIVTKGSNSLGVLEYLMKLRQEGFRVEGVLGNHEYRILNLYHNDFPLLETYLKKYRALDILSGEVD